MFYLIIIDFNKFWIFDLPDFLDFFGQAIPIYE